MKILVIHPKDPSTTFLETIYKDLENVTLITGGISKKEVHDLIAEHDRVMMLGHGCPYGLFSVGQFTDFKGGLIVDYNSVELLKEKENNVFIWCNADMFVNYYKLKGFYSGMFISEVAEADYCGIPGTDQELIDESNNGFCEIVAKYINDDKTIIHENVLKEYGVMAETNPVAFYNCNRIYLS